MIRGIVFIALLSSCASNSKTENSDFSRWEIPAASRILQVSNTKKSGRNIASVFESKPLKERYFQSLFSAASKLNIISEVTSCPQFHDTWIAYDKQASKDSYTDLEVNIQKEIAQFCEKGHTQNYYKFVNLLREGKKQGLSSEKMKRRLSSDPLVIIQHHAVEKGVQEQAHFELKNILERALNN